MEKLKSPNAILKLCCITDLISFMMNEEEKPMKGLVHEDDFYILHNTLVLMIAKEKINQIKQNGYLPIWLLPFNVLQDGNPYASRPVGNIPEFMPLDSSLKL